MTFLLLKVEWVTLSTVQRGLLEWTFAIRPAPGFVSVIADGVKSQSITRYWTKESLSNLLVACATLKNASVFLFFSFLDFPVQVHYGFSNWCSGEPYSRHMTRSFLPVGDFTINRIKASQTIWGLLGWFFEGGGGGIVWNTYANISLVPLALHVKAQEIMDAFICPALSISPWLRRAHNSKLWSCLGKEFKYWVINKWGRTSDPPRR